MATSTMTQPAPICPWECDETHPLSLTPAQEGRLAFDFGDDLEDNPYDRTKNSQAWSEWHDAWVTTQRDRDEDAREWEEYLDQCMAEAMCW